MLRIRATLTSGGGRSVLIEPTEARAMTPAAPRPPPPVNADQGPGPAPLPAALAVYLDPLNSPHTRRAYARACRQLLDVVGHQYPAGALAAPTLASYRATLVTRTEAGAAAPLTAAAVNLQLAALRAFLTFLADAGAVALSHELIRRT